MAGASSSPNKLVLIVEDNADMAESTRMLLEIAGYRVQVTATGQAALAAVNAELPDVILLDLGLPDQDGYSIARTIRQMALARQPFVVAMTGHAREEDRQRSQAAGIDLHLAKPVEWPVLEATLARRSQLPMPGAERRTRSHSIPREVTWATGRDQASRGRGFGK